MNTTSISPLDREVSGGLLGGLIALGLAGLISLGFLLFVLLWVVFRFRHFLKATANHCRFEQYSVLVANLLIVDLFQAASFTVSWHWIRLDKIVHGSTACYVQAGFLQMGDVASAFFVLAISVHTWMTILKDHKVGHKTFWGIIAGIWIVSICLTAIPPIVEGPDFFVPTAAWCWIEPKKKLERLLLHYLWVFIVEFGTAVVYIWITAVIYIRYLRGNTDHAELTHKRLQKIALYMVTFAGIYVVLTLPLASLRMYTMATNQDVSFGWFIFAGVFLSLCGLCDGLLYTFTRKVGFVDPDTLMFPVVDPHTGEEVLVGRNAEIRNGVEIPLQDNANGQDLPRCASAKGPLPSAGLSNVRNSGASSQAGLLSSSVENFAAHRPISPASPLSRSDRDAHNLAAARAYRDNAYRENMAAIAQMPAPAHVQGQYNLERPKKEFGGDEKPGSAF
ncbi:hypothetical protein K402DRAFT_423422 [Aulographum hederae CBS 113979]|uniref:G-protein coupled receptors family 1 profile domain-containing protein n=1 Tax=Aulographum hederae CBS 113979 TaxID=1176131 RepID=A0A6G1GSV6_9PEZI|nr:hypothetical protein K402DRAFT_423422 [Aulographum hederae CBS 113979]